MLFFPFLSLLCTSLHSLLGIAAHHLAKRLSPNPTGRRSPLSLAPVVFFKILAFTFLAFSKLCLSSILFLSFKNCRAFSDGFSRASFLQCPDFLGVQFSFGFPSLSFSFSAILMVFENFLFIFVHTHCLCWCSAEKLWLAISVTSWDGVFGAPGQAPLPHTSYTHFVRGNYFP